ncbi:MAG: aminoacyl-tRNA hydrolase [Candidatus Omnitrophica bacterium]|nr:aminoacyl-tRNA hydrolase [Candidatus Omnitrophota bacterium]MBI3020809.1 aminoacyl-tRNA hydrolase [Candidatus Omnitrophota bacterium]MBI3083169.1 aminoacyl-tRNA hydrolase [Candidatus Omnitrophota bacterium]
MKVIVGLGNPGHTYHETRHNVGFRVVQALAARHGAEITHRVVSPVDGRPSAVFGEYQEGAERVRLLMPLTMMNESGEALRTVEAPPRDLLLVCDDVNLPLGTIRLRLQGSAGGHHGLESCLEVLGTEEVPRLRIGVGPEKLPSDLHEFVLSRFHGTERPLIGQSLEQAEQACEVWIKEGIEMAMNRYNRAQESS